MSYVINDEVLNEIRDKAEIVDLISEYVDLKKSGSNYMGLCPFHSEKTPSFSVSQSKGIFHCFGCGVGGDQITFIMKRENLGFRESIEFLADKYNIVLQENTNVNKEITDKKNRAYSANKEAAKFYFNNLRKSKNAYNYLLRRNIDHKTITRFAIGYAPDSWDSLYKYLKGLGYKDEELEEFNLITKTKNGNYIDRFRNRIIFPIINYKSKVIGFGGRVLDDSLPKYLNTRDTIVFNKGKNLYNLNLVSKESNRKKIILVEGYMDVISLYKSGINYSVASLGTALTEDQAELIKRYGEEVYICYDGDSAGIRATKRAIDVLISKNISPKIVNLKEGLDPDDYIEKYGKFNFEVELKEGLNYLDYKIVKIKENYNLETSEGLSKFTSEAAKVLAGVKNPIEQDVYIDKVARKYNVSKDAITSYISILNKNNKFKFKNISQEKDKEIITKIDKNFIEARQKAELQIIKYALYSEQNYEAIYEYIKPHEFKSINCRIIFEELTEIYNAHEDAKNILDNLKEKKLIDDLFIKELKYADIDIYNSEAVIKELISTIIKDELEENRNKILIEIKSLDKDNLSKEEILRLKELIEKLNELNTKLKISQ